LLLHFDLSKRKLSIPQVSDQQCLAMRFRLLSRVTSHLPPVTAFE